MKRLASSLTLRLAVTILVSAYLLSRIDLADAVEAVADISLTIWVLLLFLIAADRLFAATRWIALVGASGVELAFVQGLRIFLISSFLGSFLPAGVGGDVARTWQLASHTKRTNEAFVVAAVDRWLGLTSVVMLGVVGLANWSGAVAPGVSIALYALLLFALTIGAVGLFADRMLARVVPARWIEKGIGGVLAKLASIVGVLRRRWPTMLLVIALSFVMQALRVILAWCIGVGLGIDVPLAYYFVVMPVGIVLILLPISIGGFGPAQGVIMWMLRPLQVPDAVSFAMSTLFILLGFVANLPGAVLYLRRQR